MLLWCLLIPRLHTRQNLSWIKGLILDKKFHTLPVVKEGKLVGVVGKEDILRTLITE
ncbi:MAG: CBS domain-containing protein [Deltaproteobacteria bacterium]|nr:CBS domain-containing protein [Deltaproteobacteria bacterium]